MRAGGRHATKYQTKKFKCIFNRSVRKERGQSIDVGGGEGGGGAEGGR